MTEMCPRSSVRVFTDATGGGLDGTGAVGDISAKVQEERISPWLFS